MGGSSRPALFLSSACLSSHSHPILNGNRLQEHLGIREAAKTSRFCSLEIESAHPAVCRTQDELIQMYVGLKTERHGRAVSRWCLSSAVRCTMCGLFWRNVSLNISNAAAYSCGDEFTPGHGLCALRGGWDAVALQDVAHGLIADRIAQMGEGTGDTVIAPPAIHTGRPYY